MRIANLVLAVLAAVLTVACETAHLHSGSVDVAGPGGQVSVRFTDHERLLIHDYYRGGRGLPPGLAKKGKLPPGLRKQLERRGKLPPGLQTHALPRDLERQLHDLPDGYVRVRVGGDIVLMDERTRVVFDTIWDIGG